MATCPRTCLNRLAEQCVIHRPAEPEELEDAEELAQYLEDGER